MLGVGPGTSAINGDRLNGWKEIAAHLGKGVRTVQRWEQDLGLPVHRIKGNAGEILFASVAEIERWQREREDAARAERPPGVAAPTTHHSEAREASVHTDTGAGVAVLGLGNGSRGRFWTRRRAIVLAGAAIIVCVVGALAWVGLPRGAPKKTPPVAAVGDGPTSWRVVGGRLDALDANNRLLWFYDKFPVPLDDEAYRTPPSGLLRGAVADIDGDGRRELLIAVQTGPGQGSLYCLDADGTLRFERSAGRAVRFGDEVFAPPFNPPGFQLAREAGGRLSIWVAAVHHYEFPAVVEKLDARGELLGQYWSNGHIGLLAETTMAGRRVMLVGATNNESRGGSLAVLDYDHPSGYSPAATKKYTCAESPATLPLRFFLFPRPDVFRALGTPPQAVEAVVGAGAGEVVVVVEAGGTVGSSALIFACLGYRFDDHFNLLGAEAQQNYREAHTQLRVLPEMNHPFGPRDEAEIAAVREWKDGRFVPVKIQRPPGT